MGERICIRFVHKDYEASPTLYAHWDGPTLASEARAFISKLNEFGFRRDPSNVMVNFILYHCEAARDGMYYLTSLEDASEPDWGFWEVDTETGLMRMIDREGNALSNWGTGPKWEWN